MPRLATAFALTLFAAVVPDPLVPAQSAARPQSRICVDRAHGQFPLPEPYAPLAAKIGAAIAVSETPLTTATLEGCRLLMLRVPVKEITAPERTAIVDFVRGGGSLLLAFDEERRSSLAATRVNDLIAAFGMSLTADIPYLHNTGAMAKKGAINGADRELPYSGGRAVEGGTPFAWQLDADGRPAQAFGAHTTVGTHGRVVVLAEAMATLFLGVPEGVRLTGVPQDPARTVYWGKDSAIFMEELLTWLIG